MIHILGIIRVGSRCQNPTIQNFSLKNVRERARQDRSLPGTLFRQRQKTLAEKRHLEEVLKSKENQMEKWKTTFLYLSSFDQYGIIEQRHRHSFVGHHDSDTVEQTLLVWLGFYTAFEPIFVPTMVMPDEVDESTFKETEKNDTTEEDEEENRRRIDDIDVEESELRTVTETTRINVARYVNWHQQFIQSVVGGVTTFTDETVHQLVDDVWKLNMQERVNLYRYWLSKYREHFQNSLADVSRDYNQTIADLSECRRDEDYHLLKDALIVAMTTTCAAKYYGVLEKLRKN